MQFSIFATCCVPATQCYRLIVAMKVVFNLRFRTQMGQKLSVCIQFAADASDMVLPLLYLNQDFWQASLEVDTTANAAIRYRYIFTNEGGEEIQEAEKARVIQWTKHQQTDVIAIDSWNDAGAYENAFYTAPFDAVFLPKRISQKAKKRTPFTHLFKAKAPLLHEDESLCLIGEGAALGEWNTATPLRMTPEEDWWVLPADLSGETFPVTYKYGVYNTKKAAFVRFEEGANRSLTDTITPDAYTLVHDGFARLPNTVWKGSGIAIPVFSLKSERSFGIGEFTDLKLLADWAVQTGIKLIQILPINDTTATATWRDSYPYAAISAFALHPIYINLGKVAGKAQAKTVQLLSKKGRALNSLPFVDYEKVLQFKMAALRELYDLQAGAFLQDREYKEFFEANRHWLIPYAAFCYLRDKYGTADHTQWKTYSNYNHFEVEKLVSNKNKSYKKIAFHYLFNTTCTCS
jgi:4-alpha-glucanotransferase